MKGPEIHKSLWRTYEEKGQQHNILSMEKLKKDIRFWLFIILNNTITKEFKRSQ